MAAGPGSRSTAAPSAPRARIGPRLCVQMAAPRLPHGLPTGHGVPWACSDERSACRGRCGGKTWVVACVCCSLQSTLTQVSVSFMRAHSVEHDCFGPEHKRAGPQGESREATDERRRTACVLPVPATTYVPRHSDARPPAYSRVHAHAAATPPGPRREN